MSYSLLHAKAREAIRAGNLPLRSPDKLWGGPATGNQCAVCGVSTTPGQMELEIEFARDSETSRTRYHLHPLCFAIFNREIERSPREPENPGARRAVESVDDRVAGRNGDS